MLTRGDTGQAVTALQEQLLALGYALPRWGADGDLGNETLAAVTRFLVDHGGGYIDADADADAVSDGELGLVAQRYAACLQPLPPPGRTFYDLRQDSDRSAIYDRRPWSKVTGITLHQVAVDLGNEAPDRWKTLHAHVGVSCEGNVFWVHGFEHVVAHANELNRPTVGVEFEGAYPGVLEPGVKGQRVTPAMVTAGHEAIRWICKFVAQHGGKVRNLFAHRQTAGSRRADPGEELWKLIALPMLAELGLSDGGPTFKLDNGRVIPEAWDARYVGNTY